MTTTANPSGKPGEAQVQLCVVHLIRASLRYASRRYWTPLTKDLKPIYTAADETAAAAALETFADAWGERYPAIIKLWRAHWSEFTPFLAFPPDVRRVIYTTDENVNPAAGWGCGPGCCPAAAA
jgi:putative transposase